MALRRRLPDLPAVVRRLERRRRSATSTGICSQARLPRRARRRRDLALADLPLAEADFGYDVSDHTRRRSRLRRRSPTFDRLLAEAHARGLRVSLDWVPNHTSSQHPWFLESPAARELARGATGTSGATAAAERPPNNWRSAFGGPGLDVGRGDRAVVPAPVPARAARPELGNPEVVEAMHDVLRFWLDRGVDGFRADVVHLIGKDEALPDQPPEPRGLEIVGDLRPPADARAAARHPRACSTTTAATGSIVGEVPLGRPACSRPTTAPATSCTWSSTSRLMHVPWSAEAFARCVAEAEEALPARRPLAVLGALEPRPAAPPLALRRAPRHARAPPRCCC